MEVIWVCWFIAGLVSGVAVSAWCVVEGKHDGHCNSVPDTDKPDRECGSVDRHIPTPEEITMILTYFKVGASNRETEVLDYLIDKEGGDF